MNILFLSLRGNVIGDSVRETALAKKFIDNYSKKYKVKKEKIKIYYPCGSLIYELLQKNKYLKPLLIKEFDDLNKKDVSKIKKLYLTLKGAIKIIKVLKNKKFHTTVYLGKLYKIRDFIAKLIALKLKSKFIKSGFEEAIGYGAELNFDKNENKKIKKYLVSNKEKRVVICPEVTEKKRDWGINNYLNLINLLLKKDFYVYLVGADKKIGNFFNQKIKYKNFFNLIGKLNIREVALLIKNSNLFIGNDSGLVHIASAVGTDLIVLLKTKTITEKKILNDKNISRVKVLYNPKVGDILKK